MFFTEAWLLMLDKVGMARDKEGLEYAIKRIRKSVILGECVRSRLHKTD